MQRQAASVVAEYLRDVASADRKVTDAELLSRYAVNRDEEAFGLLVQRHGPMVLGVCRRVLGPTADADDAFQATFLALARRASRVSECVAGWLHRVALRAAQRGLRRSKATSIAAEPVDHADPFAEVEWRELRAVLDAELARLPQRLHAPLVLCYLDGLTRDEAANRLGWSLRTLHRRLDEARTHLRDRLLRRGISPLILAATIFASSGLRAEVPPALVRLTIHQSVPGALILPSVERLVPSANIRGAVMKALAVALVVSAGAIGFGIMSPADAESPGVPPNAAPGVIPPEVVPPEASTVAIHAPVPKRPPDPLWEKADDAKRKAVAYLRKQQMKNGDWEESAQLGPQSGGVSALVLLALLEAGMPADDEMIKAGLEYLRTIKPAGTYMVGLQTQVYCKVDQKADAKRIAENVEWLETAACYEKGNLLGWSYIGAHGGRADASNTRYAIAGLHAAHKAGFKVKAKDFWSKVAAMYLNSQNGDGGWGYTLFSPSTATMTGSGVLCLNLAQDVLGEQNRENKTATEKGRAWLGERFKLNQTFAYYHLDVIANMGRVLKSRKLTTDANAIDWYREGCEWLFKEQKADGRFQGTSGADGWPNVSTAFALRFLASRVE